jgi:hypothetical protein
VRDRDCSVDSVGLPECSHDMKSSFKNHEERYLRRPLWAIESFERDGGLEVTQPKPQIRACGRMEGLGGRIVRRLRGVPRGSSSRDAFVRTTQFRWCPGDTPVCWLHSTRLRLLLRNCSFSSAILDLERRCFGYTSNWSKRRGALCSKGGQGHSEHSGLMAVLEYLHDFD